MEGDSRRDAGRSGSRLAIVVLALTLVVSFACTNEPGATGPDSQEPAGVAESVSDTRGGNPVPPSTAHAAPTAGVTAGATPEMTVEDAERVRTWMAQSLQEHGEPSERVLELLDSAIVGPECSDPMLPEQVDDGKIAVEILQVGHEGCLTVDYVLTGPDELIATVRKLSDEENVIAVSPLLLTPHIQTVSSWHVDALEVPHDERPGIWPTGEDVTVAIVDDGVAADHPALAEARVQRWELRGSSASDRFHGTKTAGLVAAAPNSGFPTGIAPDADLIDVPLIWKDGIDPDAVEYVAGYASAALLWAANHGADVINLSWALNLYPDPDFWDIVLGSEPAGLPAPALTLQRTVTALTGRGIITVASSGNCGSPGYCSQINRTQYPAALHDVIAVGATTAENVVANFSTRGAYVDVVAPGENITLLTPPNTSVQDSGTSFSAPIVSGLVALLLEAGADPTEIETILTSTAHDRGPPGRDNTYGHGVIDPQAALIEAGWEAADSEQPPAPSPKKVVPAKTPEEIVEAVLEGAGSDADLGDAVLGDIAHEVATIVADIGAPMKATAWPMLDPPQSPPGPACSLEGDVTVVCLVHVLGPNGSKFLQVYPARGEDDLWRVGGVSADVFYKPLLTSGDLASAVVRDAVQGYLPPDILMTTEVAEALPDSKLFGEVEPFQTVLELRASCESVGELDSCAVEILSDDSRVGTWALLVRPTRPEDSPPVVERVVFQ